MSAHVGNYDFALKLSKLLDSTEADTNLFFSPASISIVLAMCYCGAKGETKKEISDSIFGANMTDDELKKWAKNLLTLTESSAFILKFANRLYSNQQFPLRQAFIRKMINEFKCGAFTSNFERDGARLTAEINKWVEKVTNNKIQNAVPLVTFNAANALVLINAVYFKGIWFDEFYPGYTKKKEFFVKPNETIQVDMMENRKYKMWFENEDVQVLELNYCGASLAMLLILPSPKSCLRELINSLNGQKLKQWIDQLNQQHVYMNIPKFKIEQAFTLNDVLNKAGVKKAFNDDADFSAMAEKAKVPFKLSQVIHKAYIEVDEYGTEAAAVSYGVVAGACRPPPDPKRFIANRPFLFLLTIGDEKDRTILFCGQYCGK